MTSVIFLWIRDVNIRPLGFFFSFHGSLAFLSLPELYETWLQALGVIFKIKNVYPNELSETSLCKLSCKCLFVKSLQVTAKEISSHDLMIPCLKPKCSTQLGHFLSSSHLMADDSQSILTVKSLLQGWRLTAIKTSQNILGTWVF